MQATVDNKRQFVDVDTLYPGASSDYLIFTVSTLKRRIGEGLLSSE